ncbi:MAG: VWA domain-containing protein, partial [Armatimonadetes bacterium]|nr:VWA domain-containing protein [Armatimonadota bacterium]
MSGIRCWNVLGSLGLLLLIAGCASRGADAISGKSVAGQNLPAAGEHRPDATMAPAGGSGYMARAAAAPPEAGGGSSAAVPGASEPTLQRYDTFSGSSQNGAASPPAEEDGGPKPSLYAENPEPARVTRSGEFSTPVPEFQPPPSAAARPVPSTAPVLTLPAKPQQNASMYLANTYQGGSGERDRMEKLIREGVLVEGKRVRLEAFPRTYTQTFPLPARTSLAVYADAERSRIVEQGGKTYLQVALQAMKGETPRRPPLNVTLVLDLSGSMDAEGKIENARQAASQLVERLGPQDLFSLVTFDEAATLRVPAGPVQNQGRLRSLLRGLQTGSGTNIYDGLQL